MPGVKTDEQRGTFGSWLRRERKRAGFENVPAAVDALQRQAGYGIAPSVWAELESGSRRPSEEQRQRLTAFFGTKPSTAEPSGDLSAVVAAISSQTEAMRELVAELKEDREARQGRDEGLAAALALLANTLERLQPVRDGKSRTNNG